MHESAPAEVRASGMHWYEDVHEAVAKGVKGTSTDVRRGAGIVAAVSPQMDWEGKNIHAIPELHSMRRDDWDKVLRGDRTPLAGMSIKQADQKGLTKAHRLMEGEDIDDVLVRKGAPKTNSFAHNIADPDVAGPVTVDGRAHDIAINKMTPWMTGRGIGSAGSSRGPTRYEHLEHSYRQAADALTRLHGGEILPHQVQAVTWEAAKRLERAGTTKAGKPRKQGPARTGQPYFGPGGLSPKP